MPCCIVRRQERKTLRHHEVYHMLRTDSPYQKDDQVKGIVYDRSDEFGVFVAVDHQFSARIPKKDVFGKIRIGDEIEARVTNVKEDGKLDLSVRGKIPQQMDADAELILKRIQSYDGVLRLMTRQIRIRSRQSLV